MKLCECGCGQTVKPGKRFIYRHAARCQSKETRKKQAESVRGFKHTIEAKRKMSNANKNRSDEDKKKRSKLLSESRIGFKHSEESKRKMSEANKGKKLSEETKLKMSKSLTGKNVGNSHYNFGKHLSEEHKKKISNSTKGKNNHNWNGGSSFKPYCNKFNYNLREKIRTRDNRTCQNCGIPENGSKHTVHHIHYDKENCYPDLITLCKSCNSKANGNRKQWEIYYMNKLNDKGLLHWTKLEYNKK